MLLKLGIKIREADVRRKGNYRHNKSDLYVKLDHNLLPNSKRARDIARSHKSVSQS